MMMSIFFFVMVFICGVIFSDFIVNFLRVEEFIIFLMEIVILKKDIEILVIDRYWEDVNLKIERDYINEDCYRVE